MRALALILLLSSTALAKSSKDVPYTVGESFSSALRFVRIDRGCKVTDKDPDAAFITWECKDDDKVLRGSIEIFRAGDKVVRLQVTLGDEPHYAELRFLELLERKLRDERGTPPAVAPPAPKKPLDGGT